MCVYIDIYVRITIPSNVNNMTRVCFLCFILGAIELRLPLRYH